MAPGAGDIRAGGAYVEIGADLRQEIAGLKEAESRLKEWVRNSQQIADQGLSGDMLIHRVVRMGAIGRLAEVGMEAITAGLAAYRGEWDKLNESLMRLPGGWGAAYSAMFQLYDMYTGWTAKMAEMREASAKEDKRIAGLVMADATTAAAERRMQERGMSGLELEQAKIEDAKNAAIEKLKKEMGPEASGLGMEHPRAQAALAAILADAAKASAEATWKAQNKAVSEAGDKADAEFKRREEEKRRADEETVRSGQERLDAFRKSDEDELREAARTAGEIRRLRAEADPAEAARQRIEYLQSMGLDESTYNALLQKALQEAAAHLPDVARASSRFFSRGTFNALEAKMGMDAGQSAVDRTAKAAEKTAENTERIKQKLEEEGVVLAWR